MPTRVLALAALVALTACVGRRPPETVPDATRPDGTPLLPVDSTGARPKVVQPVPRAAMVREEPPAFIAVSMDLHRARLTMDDGGFPVPERQTTQTALEAQLLPLRGYGVGAAARILIGDRNGPLYSDAAILVGSRRIAADLGFASRRTYDIRTARFYDSTFVVFRPGIRSRLNIGTTGASVHGRAARYFQLPDAGRPAARLWGWNGEVGANYTLRWRYPLTANLGYRHESLRVYNRRQSVSSVTFGASVLIGRQPTPLPTATAADSAR